MPLSVLDLAFLGPGQSGRDAFAASVRVAQRAEELGDRRAGYAEHHKLASIASSTTSVLIEHAASRTRTIRVGAGRIMLPNHAPLVIEEQFGTLEALHPGRIDHLGLGRAPGTDPTTTRPCAAAPRRQKFGPINFWDHTTSAAPQIVRPAPGIVAPAWRGA